MWSIQQIHAWLMADVISDILGYLLSWLVAGFVMAGKNSNNGNNWLLDKQEVAAVYGLLLEDYSSDLQPSIGQNKGDWPQSFLIST